MSTPKPIFVREVARIDDPQFVSGQAAGHRARRLIDAPDAGLAALGEFACCRQMAVPRYQDLVGSALPVRSENGVETRVFSGAYGDMVSTTLNHHPVAMPEGRVENDGTFQHSFSATDNAFVYVLEGAVEIGPAGHLLEAQPAWLVDAI